MRYVSQQSATLTQDGDSGHNIDELLDHRKEFQDRQFQNIQPYSDKLHQHYMPYIDGKISTIAEVEQAETLDSEQLEANEPINSNYDLFRVSKIVDSMLITGQTPTLQHNSIVQYMSLQPNEEYQTESVERLTPPLMSRSRPSRNSRISMVNETASFSQDQRIKGTESYSVASLGSRGKTDHIRTYTPPQREGEISLKNLSQYRASSNSDI